MNQVFQQLLESPNAKDFLIWYINTYKECTINTFKTLPFSLQLGAFLKFLEEKYGFSLIADNTGYIAFYTSSIDNPTLIKDRFQKRNFYHIHSKEGNFKSNEYYYAEGIIQLFNNLDIPF